MNNFFLLYELFRNAEDIRREEEDAKLAAENNVIVPSYNEMSATGRLLVGSNYCSDVDEQNSICSCTCMGGASCANHDLLIDQGYQPADLMSENLSMHRASV